MARISIYLSDKNALEANLSIGNGQWGVFVLLSDTNVLHGNTAAHNVSQGFVLVNASDNELTGNEATQNGSIGFHVYSNAPGPTSTGNVFSTNAGCKNEYWDALDEGVDSIWIDNNFCTWSGF